jgi:hypothetical protein
MKPWRRYLLLPYFSDQSFDYAPESLEIEKKEIKKLSDTARVNGKRFPLLAPAMRYDHCSLVFYNAVILLIVILLFPAMMNDCGFSCNPYQVFHLRYVAAMSVDLTIPIIAELPHRTLRCRREWR